MSRRIVFFDGPDNVWTFGPVSVEYHHYCGPSFWIGRHCCNPGPWSPWWILWAILDRRRKRAQNNG